MHFETRRHTKEVSLSNIIARTSLFALIVSTPACSGELTTLEPASSNGPGSVALFDTNRNGKLDAIDFDGDRVPELRFDRRECECLDALVDADADGAPDGVDLDCDGDPDADVCELPLVDTDGDGAYDMADLNCDGDGDVDLTGDGDDDVDPAGDGDGDGDPTDGGDDDGDWCRPTPLDTTGDGRDDGMDLDCDGDPDIHWDGDGWGWYDDDDHDGGDDGCDPACIDTNGDDVPDMFDLDCDDHGDRDMDDCTVEDGGYVGKWFHCEDDGDDGRCIPEPSDDDGDGSFDDVDTDCDGEPDSPC